MLWILSLVVCLFVEFIFEISILRNKNKKRIIKRQLTKIITKSSIPNIVHIHNHYLMNVCLKLGCLVNYFLCRSKVNYCLSILSHTELGLWQTLTLHWSYKIVTFLDFSLSSSFNPSCPDLYFKAHKSRLNNKSVGFLDVDTLSLSLDESLVFIFEINI